MLRPSLMFFASVIAAFVEPVMSESKLSQKQDEPMFMAIGSKDPEFAHAIERAQASLPMFRKLLDEQENSKLSGPIRLVKTRIFEDGKSIWLWLNVDADRRSSFAASVFEAPSQFPSLKPGVLLNIPDSAVADWAVIDVSGVVSGGYSLRLQRERTPEEERAAYDSYIGAKAYAPLPFP